MLTKIVTIHPQVIALFEMTWLNRYKKFMGANEKMNPIIDYELGRALHKERDAEFERYWRLRVGDSIPQSAPKKYRVMVGIGSIALGALMIVQSLLS